MLIGMIWRVVSPVAKQRHQVAARIHIGGLERDIDGIFALRILYVSIKDQGELGSLKRACNQVNPACISQIDFGVFAAHVDAEVIVECERGDRAAAKAQFICVIDGFKDAAGFPKVHGMALKLIACADGDCVIVCGQDSQL